MNETRIMEWSDINIEEWAQRENLCKTVIDCIRQEEIDGRSLLTINESDIRDLRSKYNMKLGEMKRFWVAVRTLQKENSSLLMCLGLSDLISTTTTTASIMCSNISGGGGIINPSSTCPALHFGPSSFHPGSTTDVTDHEGNWIHPPQDRVTPPLSVDGCATNVPPEVFKTVISLGYSFLVTWITAFVMVVVHERVPDMKRYPPLPDIFLDNVPHIPWAFHMCEITGTLLFSIWLCVCIFHKYRLVLLRRFFALAGTVFLLRCVTMLITSLSVPGTHLQCNPNDYKVDDTNLTISEALELRIHRAYTIWSGLGMSIQGVRTCGDYMFSGHTVALTLLNFFITEYTPRNLYFLHTLTWLLNMFGIFFILAAHEHYSIDVFVAFYITSRLFLYYHTLANNQALMSHDSNRTRIWFPMFSYFEASVDGIIPNEFDSIATLLSDIFSCVTCIKDSFMLTARRIWIVPPHLQPQLKSFLKPTLLNPSTTSTTILSSASPTSTTTITAAVGKSKNSNTIIASDVDVSNQQQQHHQQQTDSQIFAKNLNNAQVNNNINTASQKSSTTKTNFVLLNNDIRDENLKNSYIEPNVVIQNNSNTNKKDN